MNSVLVRISGAVLLALALIGGGYWWGDNAATNRADAQALKVERIASKKLADADAKALTEEQKTALRQTAISATYQKGSSDVVSAQKNIVARIRSGAERLSVPARTDPRDAASPASAGASGRNGEARCGLSDTAAEFLTGLASEADGVALQLSACQALLTVDRAAINQEQKDPAR